MNAPAGPGWVVYTTRSAYTAEVAEIVWRRGEAIEALVDNLATDEVGPEPSPLGRVVDRRSVTPAELDLPVVVALTTPALCWSAASEAAALGFHRFDAIVDPTSVVGRTSAIGGGSVVNAMVMIGANSRLGAFVHVNRTASIGHDADLADFTTLGPRCVLAGFITVERGAFIGAGAVIAPHVRIGAHAIVGAGAVVIRDVPPFAVVAGNPAKVIRTRDESDAFPDTTPTVLRPVPLGAPRAGR